MNPPVPLGQLQPKLPASQTEIERQVNDQLAAAKRDLDRIDYRALNTDAKSQYDAVKRFITQADEARRVGNVLLAQKLAEKTGLNTRYTLEWLRAMASSGYLDYHAATGAFELSPDHAAVLVDEDSPVFLAGFTEGTIPDILMVPKVMAAMRSGHPTPSAMAIARSTRFSGKRGSSGHRPWSSSWTSPGCSRASRCLRARGWGRLPTPAGE